MTTVTKPIVGAHYRPPAKALLDVLPLGAEMKLRAEPDNAYDPNAIMVLLTKAGLQSIVQNDDIAATLTGYGTSMAELSIMDEIHVGYIPKEMAAELKASGFPEDLDIPAEFAVSANGEPRVKFQEP